MQRKKMKYRFNFVIFFSACLLALYKLYVIMIMCNRICPLKKEQRKKHERKRKDCE